jgi:hypothetical protein
VSVLLGWGPGDFAQAELMELASVLAEAAKLRTPNV